MHFLLIYQTAADYFRPAVGKFRLAHLALAWQAAERGELLLGGAVGEPADGAMLLFRCQQRRHSGRFCQSRSLCSKRPGQQLASKTLAYCGW